MMTLVIQGILEVEGLCQVQEGATRKLTEQQLGVGTHR